MNKILIAIGMIGLVGCGSNAAFQGAVGATGPKGDTGSQGQGAGIEQEVLAVGDPNCSQGNGGVEISTFLDPYNTGLYQSGDIVTSTTFVCNGATGEVGQTGSQGVQGNTGTNGQNGSSSTVTIAAASLVACPTGGQTVTVTNGNSTPQSSSVCNGAVGATGNQGVQGNVGATGAGGSPGTVVTPVTFCPGVTSYPNTFVEYGLCIGGNLYGVYSINSGFWSVLPPGNYSSDAMNSSCNFTIGANCTITH